MQAFKQITTMSLSILLSSIIVGCGNGGSSKGNNSNAVNSPAAKSYSNECAYSLMVDLNSVYSFHKEYEYHRIKKANSLIGSYQRMESVLALYSPIQCQLPHSVVNEAKLKTGALDDEEIKTFLDQMMNESLLEYHQCQNSSYAKTEREKYQCKLINEFVKENGWVK